MHQWADSRTHLNVHEHVAVCDPKLSERLFVRELLALVQQQDVVWVPNVLAALEVRSLRDPP